MKLYRIFAFAAAVAIVLFLANAPALMLRAEAGHRHLTNTEQHIAVAKGAASSLANGASGEHRESGGGR